MIIPTIKLPPLFKLNRFYDLTYFTTTTPLLKEILTFKIVFYRFQFPILKEKSQSLRISFSLTFIYIVDDHIQ